METFPYDAMGQLNNILSPTYGNSDIFSQYGQRGMNFSSTSNPLVNTLSMPLTDNFSLNANSTPTWGSAFQSFRDGDVGLSDLGGMLGSKAKSFGQGIASDISNNEFYKQNHGDLSAKNQFGNIWGGLQSLSGLYGTFKQSRMADKQYNMQKDMWNKSWDANKKSVNEAVDLRAASRFNERPEERAAHVAKYSI